MSKILISIPRFPPDFSGAGLRASRLCNRLNGRHDLSFNVLCARFGQKKYDDKNTDGMDITRLRLVGEDSLLFPIHLIQSFIKTNFYLFRHRKEIDVIHLFAFSWMNRMLMLSNVLFYKKKTVLEVTLDGADDPSSLLDADRKNRLFRHLTRFLLSRIDKFVIPSSDNIKVYLNNGLSRDQLIVRPYAVDEKVFASIDLKEKKRLRKRLGLPDKFLMLNVGMIYPRKNQFFLVQCLASLKNKDMVLLLIGPKDPENDNYLIKLKKYISSHNLEKQVIFLSAKNNIHEYMIASDVFVFSSISEGFPNVLAESSVSGLPIITLSLECLNSLNLFINEDTGKVILRKDRSDPELVQEFSDTLRQIHSRKIMYDRESIRDLGLSHFSSEKADRKYLRIYEELCKSMVKGKTKGK